MKEPIKIAVMGVGAFGALHARTLRALPEALLVALGNRTRSKAEVLARELAVPHIFGSVEELIEQKVADALVIATNTETHVPYAKAALAAGMHVLIEKPVGTDLADVESLEAVCRNHKRVAMAGHVCVFHSLVVPLVERVRQEGFRSVHFVRHRPARLACLFPEEHPVTLTMVHDLYVAAQMAGGDEPVSFDALDALNSEGKADHAWATLRWNDGRVATFHSHWILPDGAPADGFDWLEVFAPSYHTRVATNPQNWTWTTDKVKWPVELEISMIHGRPTGMLAEELRSFLAACHGAPVPAGCRMPDAVQVQRWMEQLLESAQSKRTTHSK
ncbi:MAG: Gfo/Idh/MocA family oxidoreductase [Verrucomicrobia bacterium]|nr:Gfo/Idh/MocA family oxidoreductase [Verrucomicrobiota bacterium]